MGQERFILDVALLNRRRVERGLSMRDVERATGLCHCTVIKVFNRGDVSLRTSRLVCELLGLTVGQCLVSDRTGRPWRECSR